jgi:hypothetical protein
MSTHFQVCLLIVIISRKRLNRSQQSAEAYVSSHSISKRLLDVMMSDDS